MSKLYDGDVVPSRKQGHGALKCRRQNWHAIRGAESNVFKVENVHLFMNKSAKTLVNFAFY